MKDITYKEVSIILMADTGFYDQKLFKLCDQLQIGIIIGCKMYDDLQKVIDNLPDDQIKR